MGYTIIPKTTNVDNVTINTNTAGEIQIKGGGVGFDVLKSEVLEIAEDELSTYIELTSSYKSILSVTPPRDGKYLVILSALSNASCDNGDDALLRWKLLNGATTIITDTTWGILTGLDTVDPKIHGSISYTKVVDCTTANNIVFQAYNYVTATGIIWGGARLTLIRIGDTP